MITNTNTDNVDVLVREAIQNSYDQRLMSSVSPATTAEVEFRLKTIGVPTKNFIYGQVLRDAPDLIFPGIARAKEIDQQRILYISDRNTVGLSGTTDPMDFSNRENSNFYRFFWPTKRPANARSGDGGTYGVGRHILHAMSEAETLLVFSRFLTDGGSIRELFLGITLTDPADRFMGVHFWGAEDSTEEHPRPLLDDDARNAAVQSGFPTEWFKNETATGTSIAILQPVNSIIDLDNPEPELFERQMDQIGPVREALNIWAWPHLVDKTLGMFTAEDDGPSRKLADNEVRELDDWISTYSASEGQQAEVREIKISRRTVGELKYRRVLVGQESRLRQIPVSAIALMRGVRFVVKYLPIDLSDDGFGVRGFFLAAPGAPDEVFRNSETATHDEWTTGAQIGLPSVPKLVEKTLAAIQRQLKFVVSPFSVGQAGSAMGLGQISRRLAKSIFGNAEELQPEFQIIHDPQEEGNPANPSNPANGTKKVSQKSSPLTLLEQPENTTFEKSTDGNFITNFHWLLSNSSKGNRKCSIAIECAFITGEGRESLKKSEKAESADAGLLQDVRIVELRLALNGEPAKNYKIEGPKSNLKCQELVVPAEGSLQVTARIESPLGTAVYAEARQV